MNRLAVIVMAAALVAAMLPSSAQDYMSREYMLKDTSFSKQLTREQGRALCDDILAAVHGREDFDARKSEIRQRILDNLMLADIPARKRINTVTTGTRTLDGYSVENMAMEILPGVWAYANVYRPDGEGVKRPAMILAQGHSSQEIGPSCGRMSESSQIIAASLARMGAVVLSYDMFGYGESGEQLGTAAHHTGLAQSINILSALSALDWLEEQPDVDAARIGMTGASGGGTQTFYTAAIDARIALSVPVVMVSSYFPGGCACESGRPIHSSLTPRTCNAEIAAMAVPRPLLVVSDGGDWTDMVPEVEYPFIKSVYALYGCPENVRNMHFADEGHDYGPSKRKAMYGFVAEHFGLDAAAMQDADGEWDESRVHVLPYESLLVFGHKYPESSLKSVSEVYDALVEAASSEK